MMNVRAPWHSCRHIAVDAALLPNVIVANAFHRNLFVASGVEQCVPW
ncbi:hypothetical protein [Curtobacterium ammoniigenes]|nr:hypothetical protein [Curtobacterium ammoniigenes]